MKLIELILDYDPPLEEMANLYKDDTGLEYPIWIGRVGGQHGPRVKVSNIKGKWRANNNFVVSVSENPKVLTPNSCNINNTDVNLVFTWIVTNLDDILLLWWLFEHNSLTAKDEDTGLIIHYDSIIDGLKKI
ncbi:hypothetical protein M0R04_15000 [Candidatus Dojkabacteria bacterium]|jgi:hypothetical protein|nr:hypothetical protein [Candidatus Dojkabacteria bacterium]